MTGGALESRRLLLVGPLPPPHGGRATYTKLLALNVLAIKWQVTVLDTGGSVVTKRTPPSVPVPTRKEFAKRFWRYPAHSVFVTASDRRAAGYPFLAVLLGRARRQRVVVNVLSGQFAADVARWSFLKRLCQRLTLRLSDGVVVCNTELAEAILRLDVAHKRLGLAGCFLPDRGTEVTADVPAEGFVRGHRPVLVTVGSLRPLYRLPLAVEALTHVRTHLPTAGLVVVCSGEEDADERGKFLRAVADGGEDHVAVLREIPRPSFLKLIEESDVFLRLTTHDGDSVSLHEALAKGVRCAATDTGHRPTGVVMVRRTTPEGVSEAILRALRSPAPARGAAMSAARRNLQNLVNMIRGGKV
jgi:glycogen(starch) synthase